MRFSKTFDVLYYKAQNNGRGPGYEPSHKYSETWQLTELYCPHCGKQEVWQRDGSGDYYVGTSYACVACRHFFHLPSLDEAKDRGEGNHQDWQRWMKLSGASDQLEGNHQ